MGERVKEEDLCGPLDMRAEMVEMPKHVFCYEAVHESEGLDLAEGRKR